MKNSMYNERKYLLLRKKLDELHYSLPLQIESAELADKLLNDYIKTSEGFQKLKKFNDELQEKVFLSEKSLNPLKMDNNKLIRENNQLHVDIINAKENAAQKDNLYQVKQKSIEQETTDLKFALEQQDQRCRKLNEENLAIKNKMDIIATKVYLPSCEKGFEDLPKTYINMNNRNTINMSIVKENRSGQSTLLQKNMYDRNSFSKEDNVHRLMDCTSKQGESQEYFQSSMVLSNIRDLQNELNLLKEQQQSSKAEISHLKNQVENRDSEIKRLQYRLDVGGINIEKLSNQYVQMQQNDKISILNHQIDYLNRENIEMDTIMKEQRSQTELSKVNIQLQAENSSLLERLRLLGDKLKIAQQKSDIQYQSSRSQKFSN